MKKDDLMRYLFRLVILAGFQIFFVVLFLMVLINPKHYERLRFNLPSENHNERFTRLFLGELKRKCFINFTLSGDEVLDNIAMEQIDSVTQKLNLANDTIQVVKVHFNANCTYGEFVRLINISITEQSERYGYIDDDFYIFGNPKEMPDTTTHKI